jgi:hypothetical protein
MKKGLGKTFGPDFFLMVFTTVFFYCYSFFSMVMLDEDAPILASSLLPALTFMFSRDRSVDVKTDCGGGVPLIFGA